MYMYNIGMSKGSVILLQKNIDFIFINIFIVYNVIINMTLFL